MHNEYLAKEFFRMELFEKEHCLLPVLRRKSKLRRVIAFLLNTVINLNFTFILDETLLPPSRSPPPKEH